MTSTDRLLLNLDSLHERHPGLTAALGQTYSEAAFICLHRHHISPVEMDVASSKGTQKRSVEFPSPDGRALRAYNNDIDTTEYGAYGICLAAVEEEEGLVAVSRAETLTGADFYVSPIGTSPDDLESSYRLEVSGVDAGGEVEVKSRLRRKVEQTQNGKSSLPAIASVVGVKAKAIAIEKVSEAR